MTVNELFDHFTSFPDEITFYDPKENVQDSVHVALITDEGETEYDCDGYCDFLDEYGNRIVEDWNFILNKIMDLILR